MFFLYVLNEQGLPVSEVFEQKIRDIPTTRFTKNFEDDYKLLNEMIENEKKISKKRSSNKFEWKIHRDSLFFNSKTCLSNRDYPIFFDEILQPVDNLVMRKQNRPSIVPILDVEKIRIQNIRR
jgi:hypothetical protein